MSKTVELWKRRVASWRASGETAESYSAGRGWSPQTLRGWSSRLRRKGAVPAIRLAQLVRSPSRDDDNRRGAIVVELHDARIRITIEAGADRDATTHVLAQLTPLGAR